MSTSSPFTIDCTTCPVRDIACHDCVVTAVLGPTELDLDADSAAALVVLAERGLVAPLRDPRERRTAG